ncbi:NACHT domain-containing protein [Actinacidiphila sp. bgisy145]|uniref:NACHT domain-containing protein n=1 Tax=Actinacidiphila sp. bgisy145 TaxID=3413792 RepID=UPI003EBB9992
MDLTDLERLPGAADKNFEALTRSIVSRRYGALGTMRERRNQPGVEFYLRVDHAGALGNPGRVWGWSCKWLILNSKNELTVGQRSQIEDSLSKAIKHVAGLTDFVLCLPERPAKGDEEWIDGLGRQGVRVKLWSTENYDAELAGHDELRSTFFGELALTPDALAQTHKRSVAPVEARWVPQLHTSTHVEHRIDRALLRPKSFEWLQQRTDEITSRIQALRASLDRLDTAFRQDAVEVADDLDRFVNDLGEVLDAGENSRPWEVRERLAEPRLPATSPRALRRLVLRLRQQQLPEALLVTGLGAEIRDIVQWLSATRADTDAHLLAVVGAAGQGKTHLAAQMTSSNDQPTAGVFIQGGNLRAGQTLDDLTRRIPGLKVDHFEDLLEALNSAGNRGGCRIPLVIDGLNEAERPSEWRTLLAGLAPALRKYPHVAVIVTLREALADAALPSETVRLELEWRRTEVDDILRVYFRHYLINPAGAWLPIEEFHNPLFVRMYCEAGNHDCRVPVGVEALPQSLIGVFELYREGVVERLARDPARISVPADQIQRRLTDLARRMWALNVRRVPFDDARNILDAGQLNWDESLFRRLVDEGVIFREEIRGSDETECGFVFDRLAGYLIADAILVRMPYAEVNEQLAEAALWESLLGDHAHPLGEDILIGLIALVPRRFTRHHLWRVAPDDHRSFVLAQELTTESGFLDDDTVDALAAALVAGHPSKRRGRPAFDRLWEIRRSAPHRLNATFLDRVLRQLPLPQRDIRWSEWARGRAAGRLTADLERVIERWSGSDSRSESDELNALAIAWLLTSTDTGLRDLATKALQRFGRPAPGRLFELAARMIDVDDLYVTERLIAAAFGAVTAHQMPDPGGPLEHALGDWLARLRDRFLDGGSTPTSHEQLRGHVRATYEFAGVLHPAAVPDGIDPFGPRFPTVTPATVMEDDDPNAEECGRIFGMDFENYIIGRAINGRSNYDFDHPEYRRARAEILARVWELGWREESFGGVDQSIVADSERPYGAKRRVERYGKKYGWIAYHEMVGRLVDADRAPSLFGGPERLMPDVDPTFPDPPPVTPLPLPLWAPEELTEDRSWLASGAVTVPDHLWSPEEIHGVKGGWLLVEGYLDHSYGGRTVFGFFRTLLLEQENVETACQLARDRQYPGNHFFAPLPTVSDLLAAEMPWSPRFKLTLDDDVPGAYSRRELYIEGQADGIVYDQVAVEFSSDSTSDTGLGGNYDVPSFDFAARFGLRQLPGTLDLVGMDGRRASAVFRADRPWRGHLLFLRRDLVESFAGDRRIMQVAWGERGVASDWRSVPSWMRAIYQSYAHVWRHVRVLGTEQHNAEN